MASSESGGVERLRSWKEIAGFFNADERTVRRWEARGLPIHRLPGGRRSAVYADIAELRAWLKQPAAAAPQAADPIERQERRAWSPPLAATGLVLAVGAGALLLHGPAPPAPPVRAAAHHVPPPRALSLYLNGTYESDRLTADSLRQAIASFDQAIAIDPRYADAYAGLANAWLRIDTLGMTDKAADIGHARAAAERALALDPDLARAHAAMGFIKFYDDLDFAAGLDHFRRECQLEPREAAGHHSYGMALLHAGRFPEALAEIDLAQRLDPRSRGIRAEKGMALYIAGRRREGVALLEQMAAEDPSFFEPQKFLAMIRFGEGDYRRGLENMLALARLGGDQTQTDVATGAKLAFDRGGAHAMLTTLLAEREALQRRGQSSIYELAETYALLGDRERALRNLQIALATREPDAAMIRIDPLLRNLQGEPSFQRLLQSMDGDFQL